MKCRQTEERAPTRLAAVGEPEEHSTATGTAAQERRCCVTDWAHSPDASAQPAPTSGQAWVGRDAMLADLRRTTCALRTVEGDGPGFEFWFT